MAFLWRQRSDRDLAHDIEHTLANFDVLAHQCDALFNECAAEKTKLPVDQLRLITQQLIDALGSRDEPVLERIEQIYTVAAAGCSLGTIEFRGYIAAVLTQIQHELEARSRPAKDVAEKVLGDSGGTGEAQTPHEGTGGASGAHALVDNKGTASLPESRDASEALQSVDANEAQLLWDSRGASEAKEDAAEVPAQTGGVFEALHGLFSSAVASLTADTRQQPEEI